MNKKNNKKRETGNIWFCAFIQIIVNDYLVQICGESRLQISVMNFLIMVTVHSVHSNTLRNAGNMNLFVQSPRSIVCFANLIYANRINSRGMSRVFCDLRSQKTPRGILPVNSN